MTTLPLKTAVVTGGHPYDVPSFLGMWRALPGIDAYPQDLENFFFDWGNARRAYDAVVFYNMHMKDTDLYPAFAPHILPLLNELGTVPGQGIVMLHHAILAFPENTMWSEMVGIEDRSFGYHGGQQIAVESAADHPITQGTSPFTIADETYTMAEPGADSTVLLTTTHTPSMRALAWARRWREANVFCLQHGHDALAWNDPNFRRVLERGIKWSAGRL